MKLASLKKGGRDGTLIVVSSDLSRAVTTHGVAHTLQEALDDWAHMEPRLRALADRLEAGAAKEAFPLDAAQLASPLPRAYQWLDGSAYVNHVELVRKARGAELPESFWSDPLMYQGGSDGFLAPTEAIRARDEAWGIDFEAEIAVVTDDVPMGVSVAEAGRHIKLVMLVNDVSLRGLIPGELAKGFGFVHGKPPTAFGPVAVTPDALGDAWDGGKLHLPVVCTLNGDKVGWTDAGVDMTFDFPTLVAHAAKTRPLNAGTIIGSGTVSNSDQKHGYSCIAEIRMIETIADGKPTTPFMSFGDRIRIEVTGRDGASVFGSIDQVVERV
ncbi:fumarylacetoacetate hydrolase family protein [Thalassobaculum sp.]|uniref:fumarylacetoacetate hydrolase family protein n=1 Tax=Thalassobaculum sp. TaxID=2022740 RepID=UPI0032ECC5A0